MLVRRAGGAWEQPPVQWYENEAELQALIEESPELVGVPSAVVVLREFVLPEAGHLDALLVDEQGDLTLVEAKLNRNSEIRRAVVGQLLGYAGALWGMTYEQLDRVVRERTRRPLGELASAIAGGDDFDEDAFRDKVHSNLERGAFRLVFAVDGISEDLKRAVEYLNANTTDSLEVVVLELSYSKINDIEILVPNTFGDEAVRRKKATRTSKNRWGAEDFFDALHSRGDELEIALVKRLHAWADPQVSYFYWGEGQTATCTFIFDAPEGPIQPCGVYFTASGPTIAVNFDWMRRRPRAAQQRVLDRLCALPGISALREEIMARNFAKRPSLPVKDFADGGIDLLTEALDELLAHPPEDGAP